MFLFACPNDATRGAGGGGEVMADGDHPRWGYECQQSGIISLYDTTTQTMQKERKQTNNNDVVVATTAFDMRVVVVVYIQQSSHRSRVVVGE